MYKVQSDIPVPPVTRRVRRPRKYPFETMEVGAMFFVPNKTAAALGTHVGKSGKVLGRTFAVRSVTMRDNCGVWELCDADAPGATTGVGVWRTS